MHDCLHFFFLLLACSRCHHSPQPDDHPSEVELKLKIIEIYNAKLDERERRKAFVVERDLLDYKKHQAVERRRPRDERELVASMRTFARFHSAAEHTAFLEGLLAAMRLRKRIQQLQHYRAMGMRSLSEAQLYEQEKKKRDMDAALRTCLLAYLPACMLACVLCIAPARSAT